MKTALASLKNELARLWEYFILDAPAEVVIAEPYVPYIPQNWNRVLVLAEAQNLSRRNQKYVDDLMRLSSKERIHRLGHWSGFVGVAPWDDGTLKLAVAASLGIEPDHTAVSNAVLWSSRVARGRNENPGKKLQARSVELWTRMLEVMKPRLVVTTGAVARYVISTVLRHTTVKPDHVVWALASPRVLMPMTSMISASELRKRFPEVDAVIRSQPSWLKDNDARKILYACLAVMATRRSTESKRGQA